MVDLYHVNKQFSRWRHLTTTTRIISFLLSYLNLSPRWGLKNNSSDLRKKTTNWGFLVVVIVQLSYCLKLQRAYCSSSFSHPLFSGVIFEVYWRVRELIKKERKQVTRCGGTEPFHHPPIPVVPTDNYTAFPVSQPSQTLLSSSKIPHKKKQGTVNGLMETEHELTVKLATE